MSSNESKLSASAPSAVAEPMGIVGVVRTIHEALPGVVQSVIVVANVFDGLISGVVLDPSEPGGGYVSEQELAQGAVYLVLAVSAQASTSGVVVYESD